MVTQGMPLSASARTRGPAKSTQTRQMPATPSQRFWRLFVSPGSSGLMKVML